jgi:hypothetical protein
MYLLYEANRARLDELHRQAEARRALRPVRRSAAPSQPRANAEIPRPPMARNIALLSAAENEEG